MEEILRKHALDYLGTGKHIVEPEVFLDEEDVVLLDVRTREEAESITIQLRHHSNVASMNIPVHELPERVNEIPRDRAIGIFCPANVRSTLAYVYLLSRGYTDVRIIVGGYLALTEALKPGKILKAVRRSVFYGTAGTALAV